MATEAREVVPPVPFFPLNWFQGSHKWIDYTEPWSFLVVGDVDQGKGFAVNAIATGFLAEGGFVVDVFGSDNDSETLIWFGKDSPYRDDAAIVTGDDFDGTIPFNHFKISEFTIEKAKQYRVTTTDKIFFRDEQAHYSALGRIFAVCRSRRGYKQEAGHRVMALIIREAHKVVRSQITSNMSKDEQEAQWAFVDLNSQRAHSGISPVVDNQRWMEIHNSYRDLASFKILKGFGPQVIPSELDWIFKPKFHFKWASAPFRTAQSWPGYLRNMPRNHFVGLTRWNSLCTGLVGDIPWAHYKGFDLAQLLGIIPSFQSRPEEEALPSMPEKGVQMLADHRRVAELTALGRRPIEIAEQIEKETGRHFTEGMVKYHRFGRCACEYKAKKSGV